MHDNFYFKKYSMKLPKIKVSEDNLYYTNRRSLSSI